MAKARCESGPAANMVLKDAASRVGASFVVLNKIIVR